MDPTNPVASAPTPSADGGSPPAPRKVIVTASALGLALGLPGGFFMIGVGPADHGVLIAPLNFAVLAIVPLAIGALKLLGHFSRAVPTSVRARTYVAALACSFGACGGSCGSLGGAPVQSFRL